MLYETAGLNENSEVAFQQTKGNLKMNNKSRLPLLGFCCSITTVFADFEYATHSSSFLNHSYWIWNFVTYNSSSLAHKPFLYEFFCVPAGCKQIQETLLLFGKKLIPSSSECFSNLILNFQIVGIFSQHTVSTSNFELLHVWILNRSISVAQFRQC